MNCPHCDFPEIPDGFVHCGRCGKSLASAPSVSPLTSLNCPVQLEVRCGRPTANAPAALCARITSLANTHAEISFSAASRDGTLSELTGGHSQSVSLPPKTPLQFQPLSFTASLGVHPIELEVVVNGRAFYGTFELNVLEQRQHAFHIAGPTIHNVGDYRIGDESIAMNITLPSGESNDSDAFVTIDLQSIRPTLDVRKRVFSSHKLVVPVPQPVHRLVLRLTGDDGTRRVILFGGASQLLGRGENIDLRLNCPPCEDLTTDLSMQISREHARICFTDQGSGLEWRDQSTAGTLITIPGLGRPRQVRGSETEEIRSGMCISPANALRMQVQFFLNQRPSEDLSDYARFTHTELQKTHAKPIGSVDAVRLRREDSWRDEEEYLLLQHTVAVGSDPQSCGIVLAGREVRFIHAWVHFLGGGFWLEPASGSAPVLVEGHRIPQHQLLPLVPNVEIRIGGHQLTAHPYTQLRRSSTPS